MPDSPVATVEAYFAALDVGDDEAALALLADGFVLVQADSLPYGGTYQGRDGFETFLRRQREAWATFRVGTPRCLSDGQRTVVALSTASGETPGGTAFEMPMAQVFAVDGGKLQAAHPFYFDTAAVNALLGG